MFYITKLIWADGIINLCIQTAVWVGKLMIISYTQCYIQLIIRCKFHILVYIQSQSAFKRKDMGWRNLQCQRIISLIYIVLIPPDCIQPDKRRQIYDSEIHRIAQFVQPAIGNFGRIGFIGMFVSPPFIIAISKAQTSHRNCRQPFTVRIG